MHGWKHVMDWWREQGGLLPVIVDMGMGMKDSEDLWDEDLWWKAKESMHVTWINNGS